MGKKDPYLPDSFPIDRRGRLLHSPLEWVALSAMVTFSPISMVILTLMLGIGVTYSLPPFVLMKRFIVKTMSIAVFYILCALLGMTSVFNLEIAMDSPCWLPTPF